MQRISSKAWGQSPDGPATLYTLTNSKGNSLSLSDYGGIITSIKIDGVEMVIGYDQLEDYLAPNPYYGALIGRYGNRIAGGKFSIGEEDYTLAANNGPNSLHGGVKGFDKYVWKAAPSSGDNRASVTLSHVSPDGDEGFPGRLDVSCKYEWTDDDELRLTYTATTDKTTIVNLTNHTYFNISGGGNVRSQLLQLDADQYTPVDETLIPLGTLAPVAGTPFDFTKAKPIGQDIAADHPQIALASGYDHNWAINGYNGKLREFATLRDPASGRQLSCYTTEPGVQVFTANFKPGLFSGRDHTPLPVQGAICLETQHFPDSPNQEAFTTPLLKPGGTYRTTTVYRFE
ncbi:aldose epimerase family protein [Neolewinella persica]|uniref:aldose epimerase family protein n=1 Tax=Neolewinella persica TaxID=70998 RepID=UPI000378A573|nr:aldose epimerase family protein [Neolewinella persica]